MAAPRIALVVAVAGNGVIGFEGGMPWHLPGDLKHFQALTLGHPVVMGRRTWDSLPRRPLKGRTNIVLSSRAAEGAEADGALWSRNLPAGLDLARAAAMREGRADVFVIGGAGVFAEALPLAQRLYWTDVPEEPPGDTFFPAFDRAAWREVERRPGEGCTYLTLDRIAEDA